MNTELAYRRFADRHCLPIICSNGDSGNRTYLGAPIDPGSRKFPPSILRVTRRTTWAECKKALAEWLAAHPGKAVAV